MCGIHLTQRVYLHINNYVWPSGMHNLTHAGSFLGNLEGRLLFCLRGNDRFNWWRRSCLNVVLKQKSRTSPRAQHMQVQPEPFSHDDGKTPSKTRRHSGPCWLFAEYVGAKEQYLNWLVGICFCWKNRCNELGSRFLKVRKAIPNKNIPPLFQKSSLFLHILKKNITIHYFFDREICWGRIFMLYFSG